MAASDGSNTNTMQTKMASHPTFEDVLDKLGMPGKFQIIQLTLGLLSMMIQAYMPMAFVFLGHEPNHVCNEVNETMLLSERGGRIINDSVTSSSIVYERCDVAISTTNGGRNGSERNDVTRISCPNGRNFSDAKHTTWLSDWDLVCESKGVAETSFTCFNAGLVLGGIFWSAIADRFGRKPVVIFCAFMCSFWEGVIVLSPNIYLINGFRFVSGIFRQGLTEVYFILGLELLATRHRYLYGVVICFKWVFDVLIVGLIAYLLQDYDWKYFQATVSISGIFAILYPFLMEESPRWLTAKHRFDDALSIIQRACHQNGKDYDEIKSAYNKYVSNIFVSNKEKHEDALHLAPLSTSSCESSEKEYSVQIRPEKTEKSSIFTLFSQRDLTILTLSSWFIWFAHNMTYYGLFMMSTTLAGNRFFNYTLVAFVEIPSTVCILVMLRKMERLRVVKICLTVSACSLMVYSLLNTFGEDEGSETMDYANRASFVVGKMAITASYYALFILTPEIYPTTLRATAVASCNSFSRIGSMVVPFLRPLITVVTWGPGVIFTAICSIALVLMVFLPETKGKQLVDTVADFKKSVISKKRQNKSSIFDNNDNDDQK